MRMQNPVDEFSNFAGYGDIKVLPGKDETGVSSERIAGLGKMFGVDVSGHGVAAPAPKGLRR